MNKAALKSDLIFNALWGLSGVTLSFCVFGLDFWFLNKPIPGYQVFLYPGILATTFFSEEINFLPKLSILLAGQYIAFFIVIFGIRRLIKRNKNNYRKFINL